MTEVYLEIVNLLWRNLHHLLISIGDVIGVIRYKHEIEKMKIGIVADNKTKETITNTLKKA